MDRFKGICVAKPARMARKENGAIAVMALGMICLIIVVIGGAVDLSRVYNRKFEVQSVADMAALAASRQLDGTSAGITAAIAAARQVVEGSPLISSQGLRYQYNNLPITWSDTAISFSDSPDRNGTWRSSGATGTGAGLLYVKVDTAGLGDQVARVEATFLRVFAPSQESFAVTSSAIAGKSSIDVTPLAVCALSTTPNAARGTELIEYGFRRGVSYDLMQLNPNGTTPENFLIDPIAVPGGTSASINTAISTVGPFVCSGAMSVPKLSGGTVNVQRPFPIGSLYQQFNSRFDQYTGNLCTPDAAPPDANIRAYVYSTNATWVSPTPDTQVARSMLYNGTLVTVAEMASAPTSKNYGPLWVYARAVPYSSYIPGSPEPAGGYTPFAPANWSALYSPAPTPVAYPAGVKTPYTANTSIQYPATARRPGVVGRRVLNIPLLQCPVAAGASAEARVIGIGRFFMTVPATSTSVAAEFAGAIPVEGSTGQVELFK